MSYGGRAYLAGQHFADVPGTVYLLCFRNADGTKAKLGHAGHYVGWTGRTAAKRLEDHVNGKGSKFVAYALKELDLTLVIARTMPGTKNDEYRVKSRGGQTRFCPLCTKRPRKSPWS